MKASGDAGYEKQGEGGQYKDPVTQKAESRGGWGGGWGQVLPAWWDSGYQLQKPWEHFSTIPCTYLPGTQSS